MRRNALLFTSLAICLAGGGTLTAQSLISGAIIGSVRGADGKPLAGAQIRAASDQIVRSAKTDDQGNYRLNLLGLGKWTLTVSAAGYQTSVARDTLGINETRTINFKMAPVAQVIVEVIAQSEALDQSSAQTTTNFQSEELNKMPADFSSVYALDSIISTVPGVQSTGSNSFQFFGGTQDQNLFVVDGNNTNSTRHNQAQTFVNGLPPKEFMESIEVVTGGFGAEYNVMGGVINMATKSGTNTWGSSAFWYSNLPNSSAVQLYNAKAGQNPPAPYYTNTRYGATASGPIVKDKLFVFVGVQGARTEQPASGVGGANWNGFVSTPTKQNGPNTLSVKLDWIINANHALILSSTNTRENFDNGSSYPSSTSNYTGSLDQGYHGWYSNQTTNLTWNWTISPKLFLVASVGNHTDPYHLMSWSSSPDHLLHSFYDYQYFLTGPGASATNKPNGYNRFAFEGGSGGQYIVQTNPNTQMRLDLNWVAGTHSVKVGYNLQDSKLDTSSNGADSFTIFSADVNTGLTRVPTDLQQVQISGSGASMKATYTSYYAKDLWEVVPGVHVDYGVRFDSIRFTGNNPPVQDQVLLNFSNVRRQLQPRLAVAWDMTGDGRTKLFANFGRFFETMPMQSFTFASTRSLTFSYWNASQWSYNPTYGLYDTPYTIKNDPATGKAYAPYFSRVLGVLSQNPPMAENLRLPHKDMILVGGDRMLTKEWSVGANWRYWTLKDPLITSFFTKADGSNAFSSADVSQAVVWNPHPGPVTFTTGAGKTLTYDSPFPDLKERYIALNLHAKWQGDRGFVAMNYTWTHHYGNFRGLSIAATSQESSNNAISGQANNTSDWSYYQTINSGNNEANPVHEFKLNGAYSVPVLGQRLNVGPVLTWQSGFGLTKTVPISNVLPGAFQNASNSTSIDGIMSNMGHTPTFMNLDLNLGMDIKAGKFTVSPSLAVTNVFNTRAVMGYHTTAQTSGYAGNPNPADTYFGQPIAWQTGRALTLGASIKF